MTHLHEHFTRGDATVQVGTRAPRPGTARSRALLLRATLLGCSVALAAPSAAAQDVRILRAPSIERRLVIDSDRPMIGVTTTAESERADTLGLRIESVMPGSPADKAGLKAGDRLQAIDGTSLRADRADAGEDDYSGVLNRRLQRIVQATRPGESVTLRVLSGTAAREVRVTPVKASELEPEPAREFTWRGPDADRAVIGATVASTGTLRDTLGVFVQSVTKGGPAERAGIVEGDRIAAVAGVSLRVAREDAEDEGVGASRAERLSRELGKAKAGDVVELTVVTAGRSRTVRVTTVKARDLPGGDATSFEFRIPEGRELVLPRRPLPPGGVREEVPGGVFEFRGEVPLDAQRLRQRIEERLQAMPRRAPIVVRRSIITTT